MSEGAPSRRLGILISGRGSNLQSIIDAIRTGALDAEIAVVISNRSDAAGLLRAQKVGLVCLAGFMRLVGAPLLEAFPNRILNIHPSLLPSFPGLDAQRQALEHGVRITGATVHLVNRDLDAGPIVLQAAVPVLEDDTVENLSARILVDEHRLYPEAIRMILGGGWDIEGRRLVVRRSSAPAS